MKQYYLPVVISVVAIVLLLGLLLSTSNKNEPSKEMPIFDLDTILESMDTLQTIPFKNFSNDQRVSLELDQKAYTWTDKVYITIVADAHNFDSAVLDEIGTGNMSKITIFTSNHKLDNYKLVETGSNTGIFTGELIFTGFEYDADGNKESGLGGIDTSPNTKPSINGGPTDGFLETNANDSITIVFMTHAYSVISNAKVIWNIGEIQWLKAGYSVNEVGIIRVIDPDMNLNPEKIDSFKINTWSGFDKTGIQIDVIETNEATGIFEGKVNFTLLGESHGETLRVSQGNTITAEYEDNTLPVPKNLGDTLKINSTAKIFHNKNPETMIINFIP